MSKTRQFVARFVVLLISTLILYIGLVKIAVLPILQLHAVVICISEILIFTFGLLIIAPGISQSPEKFVMRFMVLTTFQLIAALSILLAFVVSKQADLRTLCFHFIGIFVFLLTIQSILLVKINGKRTN